MAVGSDHRRNIRPYVLIFCFFWGLVLGFSAYLYMKTAAQRLEIIEVKEEKERELQQEKGEKKVEIQQIDPFKKTEDVEKPPEQFNVLAKPEVTLIEEKIIEPNFREPPVIPSPAIGDMPGLSGQTVLLPVKPQPPVADVQPPSQTLQATPARNKSNPFADESVVLDDIAPPELDDM